MHTYTSSQLVFINVYVHVLMYVGPWWGKKYIKERVPHRRLALTLYTLYVYAILVYAFTYLVAEHYM